MDGSIHDRKSEHIRIVLNEKVTGNQITTGLENVRFIHNALPEIDFDEISTETEFLGFHCKTPYLVSSMTGGTAAAERINRNLAIAAEKRGWVLSVGSTRALLEGSKYASSFQLRDYAPNSPIIANLGAVQLNYGFDVEKCKKIIELTDADMLVLHLNTIQEIIQQEGDINFKNLLPKIEKLCSELGVPVGVKEVGWGIDGKVAHQLFEAGVAYVDVAGAGGTSWSQVEKYRTEDPLRKRAAETFSSWGNPTAECILSVKEINPGKPLIASGGIGSGLDAAKAIALGADLVGFARSILQAATESEEAVMEEMKIWEFELRIAMFGIGAATIRELKETDRIVAG